jgi:hypothetical protein
MVSTGEGACPDRFPRREAQMDVCMLCFGCILGDGKGPKEPFLNALHHRLSPRGLKCMRNAGLHQTNIIST